MAATWEYYFEFYSNQIFGRFFYAQPRELFLMGMWLLGSVVLIGMIRTLYRSYKEVSVIETLLFLLSLISFLIVSILGGIERLCFSTWGLPQLGDLIHIFVLFPIQFSYICVNIFALRITFPEKFKIILPFLVILSIIYIGTLTWAHIQGPPYAIVVNFAVAYTPEITLTAFVVLIPIGLMPIGIFFYFAIKMRKEDKAKSNRAFWFGMGFLFFAAGATLTAPNTEFFVIFTVAAGFIFYLCFEMPEWFKRRIGWPE